MLNMHEFITTVHVYLPAWSFSCLYNILFIEDNSALAGIRADNNGGLKSLKDPHMPALCAPLVPISLEISGTPVRVCHGKNGPPKIGSPRNEFFEKYGPPGTYFTAKFGPPLKNLDPSKSCAGTIF